jgi:hypothetical protein|nr:MAG TPA: hypothetical protein [Caudoviricetes sp.]
MTNWPTAPLIRIIKGSIHGSPIDGKFAVRATHGGYGIDTHFLPQGYFGVRIDKWEDITPVPTAALKRLQDAFRGIDVIESLEPPLLEVLSYLTVDKPTALARAVTRVKDIAGAPMVDAETLPADRLSLLLDALASVQSASRKVAPLAMVARICVDWADLENPRRDSLEAARARIEVLSDSGSFIVLSSLVGDVTTALCDNFSPRHDLIDAGAYALAWAAQIIEEEDK